MSEIQVWKVFLMRKSVDAHVTGRFRRRKGRDTEEKKSLGNCETSTSEDASKTSRRIPWVNQSGAIVAEKQMARHKKGSDDLVQGLLARSPEVRMESIESLGLILKKPIPELMSMLKDKNDLVRVYTVEALENIGDRSAARPLRKALRDASPLVRSYAASALGALRDHSARMVLHRTLLKEHSPRARVGFLVGLFLLGDKQQLPLLMALVDNKSYRVRCAAANTLAQLPLEIHKLTVRFLVSRRLRHYDGAKTGRWLGTLTDKSFGK